MSWFCQIQTEGGVITEEWNVGRKAPQIKQTESHHELPNDKDDDPNASDCTLGLLDLSRSTAEGQRLPQALLRFCKYDPIFSRFLCHV